MTKATAKRPATTKQPTSKLTATRSKAKRVGTKTTTPVASKVLPAASSTALPRKAPDTRADSKQARVLALLRSTDGCTIEAIMKATGWKPHSVRGFFAGVVRKKLKLDLESDRIDDVRRYRIKPLTSGVSKPDKAD